MTEAISLTTYGEIFYSAAQRCAKEVPPLITQSLRALIDRNHPKGNFNDQFILNEEETILISRIRMFCESTLPMSLFMAIGDQIQNSNNSTAFTSAATRKPTVSALLQLHDNQPNTIEAIMRAEHRLAMGTYADKLKKLCYVALFGKNWDSVDQNLTIGTNPDLTSISALNCVDVDLAPATSVDEFINRLKTSLGNLFEILKQTGLTNEDHKYICAGFGITAQTLSVTIKFIEENEKEFALYLQGKEIPQGKHRRKRDAYLALIKKLKISPTDVQTLEERIRENNIEHQLGNQALSARMGKGLRSRWMEQTLQELRTSE